MSKFWKSSLLMLSVLIAPAAWSQTAPVDTSVVNQPQENITSKSSVDKNDKYAKPNTNHDAKQPAGNTKQPAQTSLASTSLAATSSSGGSAQIPTLNSVSVQVEPFSGSANVPVPINVPVGRAGIQPNIVLNYNSNSPEGFLGVGWTLDFGSIQRSTKKGVPKYDSTDTFEMVSNGSTQELIFDAAKNIYRPEIEGSFSRIEKLTGYWLVTDKKGTKYYFGQTSDSRIAAPVDSFKWALNRVEDLNGNYLTITYLKPDGNNIFPSAINYTGNSKTGLAPYARVTFDYTGLGKILTSRRPGFELRTAYLLTTILVYANGSLQNKYILNFTPSPVTARQLLTSITQYASDGTSPLPPVKFSYQADKGFAFETASWSYPADMDFTSISSGGYKDMGTRLMDVNGDVYPDLIRNFRDCDFQKNIKGFLNNKNKGFASTPLWQLLPENYLTFVRQCSSAAFDYGLRFVDVNGDGLADAVWSTVLTNGTVYNKTYLAASNGTYTESAAWAMPSSLFVTKEVENAYTLFSGLVMADVNGDGYNDIVWSKTGTDARNWVYLNNAVSGGTGWTRNTGWDIAQDGYSDFTDGATLADLNGDGLPEIVYMAGGAMVVHYNLGAGWRPASIATPWDTVPITENLKTGLSQFADMNGDGLVDIVSADVNASNMQQLKVVLNTGAGWLYDPAWNFWSGSFATYDTRLADVNADGMTDAVYSLMGGYDVMINKGKPSDLLIKIDNGIGGSTEVAYDSSAHFNNTFLPFPVQVVASLTVKEALGSSYKTSYVYSQGLWDTAEREFRGFGSVKVIDPNGNYTVTNYHQDKFLKGRPKDQAAYDAAGSLFNKTVNTWQQAVIVAGSQFVFLKRTDNYLYDGASTGKRTAQEFFYDETTQYGNLTKTIQYGEVDWTTGADTSNDKRTTEVSYLNNASVWLLGIPKQVTIKNNLGTMMRQTSMYYDSHPGLSDLPTVGLLTKQVQWAGATATVHPAVQYGYDGYGNVTSTTDPLGNVSTITYDPLFLFPLTAVNALNQSVKSEYYGINGVPLSDAQGYRGMWGQLRSSTDANNQKSFKVYDVWGRVVKVISPLDTMAYPTATFDYKLTSQYVQVTANQRVKSGTGQVISVSSFYDGLGRLIQSKTKSGVAGQYIVSGQTQYNSRGLPEYKYAARLTTANLDTMDPIVTTSSKTTIQYDAMGRTLKIINADNTYSNTVYSNWTVRQYNERGARKDYLMDAYGRLARVQEYGGRDNRSTTATAYWVIGATSYTYDSEGNLVAVSGPKTTSISYDALGRKTAMNDPDMHTWQYSYDLNGNLLTQKDALSRTLTFAYDKLNRLTKKTDGGAMTVSYAYDNASAGFAIGRLTSASYANGSTSFFYDQLGRENKSTKSIGTSGFTVQRSYDDLNNLVQVQYPDNKKINYEYNDAGQVIKVVSDQIDPVTAQPIVLASNIQYNANGQMTSLKYGNGSTTTNTYDPVMFRLQRIYTVTSSNAVIQDLNYTYDAVGNIAAITDKKNTATQSFKYDDLNRLTQAVGSYGTLNYSYSADGNILTKEGVTYTYGQNGAGPHSVTSLSDGTTITYDLNGNMTSLTKAGSTMQYAYDVENRLIEVKKDGVTKATYSYDGDSGRVSKTVYGTDTASANTCFLAGTQVLMSDGTMKPIESVRVGDVVMSFDEKSLTKVPAKVTKMFDGETAKEYLLVNGHLKVTPNHQFYSKGEWKEIGSLSSGDALLDDLGKEIAVEKIEKITAQNPVVVYNLEVEGNHNYFAGGYLVHNKLVMGSLSGNSGVTTTYVGSLYEETGGVGVDYVFLGSTRLASISAGKIQYYHTDHLGGTNLISDSTGAPVELIEYKPFGEFYRRDRLDSSSTNTAFYFTNKPLDDETGLYYYGARYYNPILARFITPDIIVPYLHNPQALNRYSYAGNNPVSYLEDGHGWFKKFISGFGSLFGLAGDIFKGIIAGDWSSLKNVVTATATTFVLSWGNPVATMSAFVTTSITESKPGKELIKFYGEEIYDDVLGMRPRTAQIWAAVGVNIGLSVNFETVFASMLANPVPVKNTPISEEELEKVSNNANYAGDEKMYGPSLKSKDAKFSEIIPVIKDGEIVGTVQYRILDVPALKQLGAHHISANMLNVSKGSTLNPLTYASWGVCHQATNLSLLKAGVSSVALDIHPTWDMYVTTAIYGNYGGQIGSRTYAAVTAKQSYGDK